jgi:hypothetical protein
LRTWLRDEATAPLPSRIAADAAEGRHWLRLTPSFELILFAAAILAVSTATTIAGPGE